jgi:hypothetical protein
MVLFVGLVAQVGCSGQSDDKGGCAALCERGLDECPELPRVRCEDQCLYEDQRAQKTGCQKQVDAVAKCSSALDDICTTQMACDPEIKAVWACIGVYCMKHPSYDGCPKPPNG